MPNAQSELKRTIDEAVDEFARTGYVSAERLLYWEERIRRAAQAAAGATRKMDEMLRDVLGATYRKMIDGGAVYKFHPGVERWTIERIKPSLRGELDRRIMANANLIRLKKATRVEETVSRFSAWGSSQPAGGSAEPEKAKAKRAIKKPIASLPFEERRVLIDQGHKLTSAINSIVAVDGGAIAALWRSHWRQPGYDYRPDHKERDQVVYGIEDSWAFKEGLVKKPPAGWSTSITEPAEEPFCRCSYVYMHTLRDVEKYAPEMLTAKGRAKLDEARAKIKAMN